MNASCESHQSQLGPYLDRELPETGMAEARRHLEGCAACSGMLARLSRLEDVARASARAPAVSAAEWARVGERVRTRTRVLALPGRHFLRAIAAAAAILIVSAVTVPTLLPTTSPRLPISMEPGANDVVVTEIRLDGYAATIIMPGDDDSTDPLVISLCRS